MNEKRFSMQVSAREVSAHIVDAVVVIQQGRRPSAVIVGLPTNVWYMVLRPGPQNRPPCSASHCLRSAKSGMTRSSAAQNRLLWRGSHRCTSS